LITDIYSVRDTEQERAQVHARDLVAGIRASGQKVSYVGSLENAPTEIIENLHSGDVLLTVGAGSVNQIIEPIFSLADPKSSNTKK
jgi:UDP-N-acetylmuramate--alanine ligase